MTKENEIQWASAINEAEQRNKSLLGNKPIYKILLKSTVPGSLTTEYYLSSKLEENMNYIVISGFLFKTEDPEMKLKKTKKETTKIVTVNETEQSWDDIIKSAADAGIKEQSLRIPWSEIRYVETIKNKIKTK